MYYMKNALISNYHTHTKRCHHALGEDKEYVEEAIKAGIKYLGFSDHSPMPFRAGYVSGIRMSLKEADAYFASIESLKKEYKKDITIYAGVEAEYYPEIFHKLIDFLADYPLDYMICGQHFLNNEEDSYYMGSPFSNEKILRGYVDNVKEAIDSGKYLYIAHPDLPQFVGAPEIYDKYMRELCLHAKERDIPLELNVLGYVKRPSSPPYPTRRFFKIAKETGNRTVVGIDAHSPAAFADYNSQKAIFNFADSLGITPEPFLKI